VNSTLLSHVRLVALAAIVVVVASACSSNDDAQPSSSERAASAAPLPSGALLPAGSDPPPLFVATTADGRIALVRTETGKVDRVLVPAKPGGGAATLAMSGDRRTVYFTRGDGTCAAHLARVPVGGGAEQRVSGELSDVTETLPAIRPDGKRIAFVRYHCPSGNDDTRDEEDAIELVIASLVRGVVTAPEQVYPDDAFGIAWSEDGSHLAYRGTGDKTVHILDVSALGRRTGERKVKPTCRPGPFAFRPKDGSLVLYQRCTSGRDHGEIVSIDPDTGKIGKQLVDVGDLVARQIAFDASGKHLLYLADRIDRDGSGDQGSTELYRWSSDDPVRIGDRVTFRDVAW
jgi:dipeptidyl aminopeptidase/acylaminoacyl peptidase